jgi:PKD repeat protein
LARNFAGTLAGASGNDVAHYVGTSIMNVLPGEKRKVYFALMIGNSLADLRASGDEAQVMVNPSVSPVPVFTDSVFCAGGPYVISPSGGTNFAFYSPWNPTVPLHIGNSFTVPADSASNVYLVTCRDSIVESLPRWISYEIVSPAVNIGAPASIIIPDVPSVALTSLSPTAVAWSWNFGNGFTSNLPNPTTAYHSSGVYTITLTVTDINGCTASTSRNISVVRRSPVPIINPTYHFVCWDEKVVIAPANGTNFRFYRNAALTDFMLQASQLTVTDPLLQNVWVTCIDSLLESSAVQVTIRRSFVRPEFNVSPVFDTIIFASVNFTDLTVSDFGIIQWEWNFGDGTPISTQRNPSHTYNAQGVYEVKLRARNSMGCWGEIRRTFKVGKRSPVPLLTDNSANVCVGDKAFIFPLNGTIFNYYSDAALTNRIFRGKNYEHTVTESSPNVLYITCADSLIESAPRAFRINKFSAFADFEYPREVLIHVSNRANFIDKSRDAVEWEWDFGNGTFSSAKSPTAIYRGQGTFTVKLTIKDSKGCKATVSKKILVVNRSPQPHVPNYKICKNDRVTIAPEGGSVFKFYESEFAPNPVWVGRTYQTPRLHANRTYFITCADSAIESPAARCEVILSRPITNFIMSDDSLNLFRTDTVFFRDRSLYAKRWLWNFGNGRNGFVPNTFSVYKEKKSYTVSLVTFDSLNCLDTMRRVLVVYDSAVVASLDPEDDYDFAVFPVPASEQINIAFSKYGHLPISYRLYSASGQLILETQPHISEKSFESIRTAHLPRGFYVLNVKIGDKDFRRKVILE